MSTVDPFGTFSIASWKPWTGGETVSGSARGNSSGNRTRAAMIRKIQRRSSFSIAGSQLIDSILPAQVGALDAQDHAQTGRHDAQGGADQDRALGGVLGHVHDPFLARAKVQSV